MHLEGVKKSDRMEEKGMGEIEAQGASVYMITALCPADQDRVRRHKWQNEN